MLLATAALVAGCATTPAPDPAPEPPAVPAPAADRATQDPAPEAPAEPVAAPQTADEWCQAAYTDSGVVDYVLAKRGTVQDTAIRGDATISEEGVGHVLMCSGYDLMLTVATFSSADLAREQRALVSGIVLGEPDTIAGHDGEYQFAPADVTGGGVNFWWQTELSDLGVMILLPGVTEISEPEIRDVLAQLVTVMSQLPVPEPDPVCLSAPDSVLAAVAENSDDLGLTEDGIDVVSALVVELRERCGYQATWEALGGLSEPEYVMGELYDALGPS